MKRKFNFLQLLCIILITTEARRTNGIRRRNMDQMVLQPNSSQAFTIDHLGRIHSKPVTPGDFPYIGYLTYGSDAFCAASVIHQRWFLTAAQCFDPELVYDKQRKAHLVVGTNKLNSSDGEHYEIDRVFVHPDYRRFKGYVLENVMNDIALVRLKKEIQFNDRVKPVTLPKGFWFNQNSEWGTTLSWGKSNFNVHASGEVLSSTKLEILTLEECSKIFPARNTHICTSFYWNADGCQGDLGGPLLINDIQVGIISSGNQECGVFNINLNTRVTSYSHWIRKHVMYYGNHMRRHGSTVKLY